MPDAFDPKRLVRESYDRLGDTYSSWASGIHSHAREHYASYLLEALPAGSRILDLGCGDGTLITTRLCGRFRVVGVDLSSEQLARARSNAPDARLICADIATLSLPSASVDGVAAFYCLMHLPPDEVPSIVQLISQWLRPGGLFIGTFGAQHDPGGIELDWLGVPMFFSGFDPPTNRSIVERTGLAIEVDALETDDEYGQSVTFHWLAGRKI